MRRFSLALVALAMAAPAVASEQDQALPSEAEVQGALDQHPSVLAARAQVEAAKAQARGLARSPYELAVTGQYDRRRIDREGDYDEYNILLGRPIRLPGKAALDKDIGRNLVDEAENLAEDARHQAAILLIGHWWDWLGAAAQADVDRKAVDNYGVALKAVERRVALRDASQLEADQARAALASARAMAEQSAGRAALARARLVAHFPGLTLPQQPPDVPSPEIDTATFGALRDLVIANSHEIAAADARARAMADRASRDRKDRMADPTMGLRVFSERGGAERGAGVALTVPLGGGYRKAQADRAAAEASAARSEADLARFTVRETADADLAEARFRMAAWQRARESVEAQMTALAKQRRGHEMGEIGLADLLYAERMVHDAFRAEVEARTEADRAVTKLRIDAHALWLGD